MNKITHKSNTKADSLSSIRLKLNLYAFIFTVGLSQGAIFSVSADVLLIDRVEAKAGMAVPQTAATMNQVRADYGDPIKEHPAVGEPPITRWDYANFRVFFEHQHVITTVLNKSKETEVGPKSLSPSDG